MDFLSSPVHNYSYETFDDAFFELPKEMDFDLTEEFRDNMSCNIDEDDDLNDGMYGVWNVKHPWSVNNNSSSHYNSNLHLDFIGGDPESAIMVNPHVVIPNGFEFDKEREKLEDTSQYHLKENISLDVEAIENSSSVKLELPESAKETESNTVRIKNLKNTFLSLKENITNEDYNKTNLPKNGIRVLKPAVVESSLPALSSMIGNNQTKSENINNRLKHSLSKNINNSKCNYYYPNDTFYPKPAFSYSCLIAMALKNSKHGCLPVAEIYNFMCNHFPYFKTAPNGWKNSVRHNLSLNKCFEKIEKPAGSTQRKGCLWALNPSKAAKLEEEVQKCTKKDVVAIKRAMEYPEHLELLERGELKSLYDTEQNMEDDEEEDVDTNEEDTEGEEPNGCEEDNEEKCENEDEVSVKTKINDSQHYSVLNIAEAGDVPEFKIEVDESIYEELIGSIKNEQLFSVDDSEVGGTNSHKKIKKYLIQVENGKDSVHRIKKNEPEIFDHYDINNLLRLESENKITSVKKTPPRFNKRVCPNSRIKQIKFKTWD